MKTYRYFTKVGMALGICWMLATTVRYYMIYSDFDRWLSYSAIGALIWGFSVFYDQFVGLKYEAASMGEYLADKPWEKRK